MFDSRWNQQRTQIEDPNTLLIEVAHLDVGDLVGVEVDLGELGDHLVEQVGLVETRDLGGEVELVDDVTYLG
jgi:hypothetical protein